jgi:hypothetical protein
MLSADTSKCNIAIVIVVHIHAFPRKYANKVVINSNFSDVLLV